MVLNNLNSSYVISLQVYLFDVASMGLDNALSGTVTDKKKKCRSRAIEEVAESDKRAKSCSSNSESTCNNLSNNSDNFPDNEVGNHNVIFDSVADPPVESVPIRLADILSSPKIGKVMIDSRHLSDFLHHHTSVTLCSLFDLQATELYLYMVYHKGDCIAFVPSLSMLLAKYTNVDHAHLLLKKLGTDSDDRLFFYERPLDTLTLSRMASSVVFLKEIHVAQLEVLNADHSQITNVYSSAYALMDDVTRVQVEHHVVPKSVQQLGGRTVLRSLRDKWDM